MKYYYHAESECLWAEDETQENWESPIAGDGLIAELTKEEFEERQQALLESNQSRYASERAH